MIERGHLKKWIGKVTTLLRSLLCQSMKWIKDWRFKGKLMHLQTNFLSDLAGTRMKQPRESITDNTTRMNLNLRRMCLRHRHRSTLLISWEVRAQSIAREVFSQLRRRTRKFNWSKLATSKVLFRLHRIQTVMRIELPKIKSLTIWRNISTTYQWKC